MRSAESPLSTPIRGSTGNPNLFSSQRTSSTLAHFEGSPMMSPLSPLKTPERQFSDRFIPERESQDSSLSHFMLVANNNHSNENTAPRRYTDNGGCGSPIGGAAEIPTAEPYTIALSRSLFPAQASVLGLHHVNQIPTSEERKYSSSLAVVYQNNKTRNFRSNHFRVIAQTPEKILDAPEMLNDFYLNLIDWSSRDVLAVALNQTTYLWCAESGSITQLTNMDADQNQSAVTGVSWNSDGTQLAVGLNDGEIQLWDTEAQRCLHTTRSHQARVCSLSWNQSVLASGSRDTTVSLFDTRDRRSMSTLTAHKHEVCGLRWSPNGTQLATGGNDNHLFVYDYRRTSQHCSPLWQFSHNAAVKALAWNPVHQNLLLSGGGSADQTLRFWSTRTGECLDVVNTNSQVSGVLWNHAGTEFVSSHGYSDNRLTVWKYPSMKRLANLTGHTHRVLHLALSPDGQTVVSAAGDETIRFWRCFPSSETNAAQGGMNDVTGGYGSPTRQRSSAGFAASPGSPKRQKSSTFYEETELSFYDDGDQLR